MVISSASASALSNSGNTLNNITSTNPTASSTDPNNLASEQTFLKLFVAQLQNQDPLNPNAQDPTQMVSELAQFSELEQLVNIGQNVQSIDQTVVASSSAAGGAHNPSSTGTAGAAGAVAGA